MLSRQSNLTLPAIPMCLRHLYRILQSLPIQLNFLPNCYKAYEVRHSVRDEYTAQADEMMAWHNDHGDIMLIGTLDGVIPNDLFEEPSDSYFIFTLNKSKDTNQASTEIGGKSPYTPVTPVNGPLRTQLRAGTLSQVAWVKLQPTVTSITDHIVSKRGWKLHNEAWRTHSRRCLPWIIPVQPLTFLTILTSQLQTSITWQYH